MSWWAEFHGYSAALRVWIKPYKCTSEKDDSGRTYREKIINDLGTYCLQPCTRLCSSVDRFPWQWRPTHRCCTQWTRSGLSVSYSWFRSWPHFLLPFLHFCCTWPGTRGSLRSGPQRVQRPSPHGCWSSWDCGHAHSREVWRVLGENGRIKKRNEPRKRIYNIPRLTAEQENELMSWIPRK